VSDLQQAQYLIRSIFCFAERDVDRAYIYFYDDDDKASVHAASGLTRKFEPKMSFWAVKHFYETLGEYRFNRIIRKEEAELYVYEFVHASINNQVIWLAWSPTGTGRELDARIEGLPGKILKIEQMPVREGAIARVETQDAGSNAIKLKITESPVYIMMGKGE